MDKIDDWPSKQFLLTCRSNQLHAGAVDKDNVPIYIYCNSVGGTFNQFTVFGFAFLESLLRTLPFSNVLNQTVVRCKSAVFIAMEYEGIPHPSHASIFMDDAMFNRQRVFAGQNSLRLLFHLGTVICHHHSEP